MEVVKTNSEVARDQRIGRTRAGAERTSTVHPIAFTAYIHLLTHTDDFLLLLDDFPYSIHWAVGDDLRVEGKRSAERWVDLCGAGLVSTPLLASYSNRIVSLIATHYRQTRSSVSSERSQLGLHHAPSCRALLRTDPNDELLARLEPRSTLGLWYSEARERR